MIGEIKYCKFCNKEKPIEEFVKSGFAIRNICRECQNKKQTQIYRDSKKVKELEKENKELKKQIETEKEQVEYLRRSVERKEEIIDDLKEERIPYTNEYVKKLENQQKEFIEWLETNIAECDEFLHNKDNYWDEDGRGFALTRKAAFVEALSKCKEIVGVKDE